MNLDGYFSTKAFVSMTWLKKLCTLRWRRDRDFDGSHIPVITEGLELRTSLIQCIYLAR